MKALLAAICIALSLDASAVNDSLKHKDNSNWLIDLPDTISIADINLPGSHDAAAINPNKHTPYSCHTLSIPEQLESGIRILDIRIKVKGKYPDYSFATCHGSAFGGSKHFNEYQSLGSVLDECTYFLKKNPSECIVVLLKIDDWNKKDTVHVFAALDSLLFSKEANYPIYSISNATLPTLGKLRGSIYLLNRVTSNNTFGAPVKYPLNTAALVPAVSQRLYPIYIQDQFEKLAKPAERTKLNLVKQVLEVKKKGDGQVLLNYATARQGFKYLYKVYIQDSLLTYIGTTKPGIFGWLMLDYESQQYVTDKYGSLTLLQVIISSNFGYKEYPERFKILAGQTKNEK